MKTLMELLATGDYYTDKDENPCWHPWHTYVRSFYESALRPYRDLPIELLEIGVYRGGSLKLWRDYFKKAKRIVGVDVEPCEFACRAGSPVDFIQKNAYHQETAALLGNFHIIIEDGSHVPEDQEKVLEFYLSKLRAGGFLVIEDVRDEMVASRLESSVCISGYEWQHLDLSHERSCGKDNRLFIVKSSGEAE